MPNTYEPFNAAVYTIDILLPFVDLKQEDYWTPLTAKQRPPSAIALKPIDSSDRFYWRIVDDVASLDFFDIARLITGREAVGGGTRTDSEFWSGFISMLDRGLARLMYWTGALFGWLLLSIAIAGYSGLLNRQ